MKVFPIVFATPEYDEALHLRDRVLRQPLGLSYTEAGLSEEYKDIHLACFNEQSKIVGCLLLTPIDEKKVQMRQVAVEPELQGKGIGRNLVEYFEMYAQRLGFEEIILHARDIAIPFYEHLGYESFGEPFEEVTILHRNMRKWIKKP